MKEETKIDLKYGIALFIVILIGSILSNEAVIEWIINVFRR